MTQNAGPGSESSVMIFFNLLKGSEKASEKLCCLYSAPGGNVLFDLCFQLPLILLIQLPCKPLLSDKLRKAYDVINYLASSPASPILRVGATFSCIFILRAGRTWVVWLLCLKSVHGKVCQASQNLLVCFCFCFFGSSLSHILVKSISYGSVCFCLSHCLL